MNKRDARRVAKNWFDFRVMFSLPMEQYYGLSADEITAIRSAIQDLKNKMVPSNEFLSGTSLREMIDNLKAEKNSI